MIGRMELLKLVFTTNIIWIIYFTEYVTSETCSFFQSGTSIVAFCENGCCSGGCCMPSQPISVAIIAVIVVVIVVFIMLVIIVIVCCIKCKWKPSTEENTEPVSAFQMSGLTSTNRQRPQYHREKTFVGKTSRKRNNDRVHYNDNHTRETSFIMVSS